MSRKFSYEGIVVLGAPRSGTTLVRRLLDAHPAIGCPPETNLLRACSRFLEEHPFAGGMGHGVLTGLALSGIPEEDVVERLRTMAFGWFRELCERRGKRIWAEKSAFDCFHLEGVERLCSGHCHFLLIYRHGLDVTVSLGDLVAKMETYVPELHRYIQRFASPPEAMAHAWADACRGLLAFEERHPERCTRVRYEDLVSRPAACLQQVLAGLGLEGDVEAMLALDGGDEPGLGDWKTYQKSLVADTEVGRWSRALSLTTVARIAPVVNPLLETLGYRPVTGRELSAEEARHRYQLGLMAARMRSDA